MKPYRPNNGTEGIDFTEYYCMRCMRCDPDPEGPTQCEILCKTFVYDINDPQYPKEWIQDDDGNNPRCIDWVKWDWGNDGDPNDPDNPKSPPSIDPNQLDLFPLYPDESSYMDRKLNRYKIDINRSI